MADLTIDDRRTHPREDPPTSWIRISTPARRSRTPLTIFSTPSAVLRSASTNSSGWCRPSGADRDVVITFAPALLRRSTMASPIPLVPPVTSARLPANSVRWKRSSGYLRCASLPARSASAHSHVDHLAITNGVLRPRAGPAAHVFPSASVSIPTRVRGPCESGHPAPRGSPHGQSSPRDADR